MAKAVIVRTKGDQRQTLHTFNRNKYWAKGNQHRVFDTLAEAKQFMKDDRAFFSGGKLFGWKITAEKL